MLKRLYTNRALVVMTVIGLAIFVFAIAVLMTPYTNVVGMDQLGALTCLQMAGTPERAVAAIQVYDEKQLEAIKGLLIPGDVTFAWGYGFLYAGLLGLLSLRLNGGWQKAGRIIMCAPLIASLFDVFEDLGLYSVVGQVLAGLSLEINPATTAITFAFASLKYFLLAVVAPVFAFAGTVQAIKTDRRWTSIIVYVLVVIWSVSMVQKPLAEIPACF